MAIGSVRMTTYNGFMTMMMTPPRHLEYEMTMTRMPDVIEKNDGVMTIWPLLLMTPPLVQFYARYFVFDRTMPLV